MKVKEKVKVTALEKVKATELEKVKATALEKVKATEKAKQMQIVVVIVMMTTLMFSVKTMKLFVSAIYIDGVVDQQHLYLVVSDE